MEGRRGPRIQPPPWAPQNLGPALRRAVENRAVVAETDSDEHASGS